MTHSPSRDGRIRTRIEGRMVVSDITGPCDRALVEHWALSTYHDAVTLAATGPWIAFGHFLESMICPPDALDSIRRTVQYSVVKLQCVGYAVVAGPEVAGRELMAPTFSSIYEGLVPYRMFDDVEAARAWAQGLLDQLQQD